MHCGCSRRSASAGARCLSTRSASASAVGVREEVQVLVQGDQVQEVQVSVLGVRGKCKCLSTRSASAVQGVQVQESAECN